MIRVDLGWRADQKRAAKELFGRPLRLALAAWIATAPDRSFYLQEAQDAMRPFGEAPSAVAQELRLFTRHGMLLEIPVAGRVYFTPQVNPLWDAFSAAALALGLLEESAPPESSATAGDLRDPHADAGGKPAGDPE